MNSGSGYANFTGGDAYELYMGRWSRLAAPLFLDWLAIPTAARWLDVGSGTGALTQAIISQCDPTAVSGIERSPAFVEQAEAAVVDHRVKFEVGDAQSIPVKSASYDAVVSGLVLNFIPDVDRGISEMVRVANPGGTVAAYVWDYSDKMEIMRQFWDVAVTLDSSAISFDEGQRDPPLCQPDALTEHFKRAGLFNVKVHPLDVKARFVDFDDYWNPFTGNQGSAPTYLMSLDEIERTSLKELIRKNLPISTDGSVNLIARAWAVCGKRDST